MVASNDTCRPDCLVLNKCRASTCSSVVESIEKLDGVQKSVAAAAPDDDQELQLLKYDLRLPTNPAHPTSHACAAMWVLSKA